MTKDGAMWLVLSQVIVDELFTPSIASWEGADGLGPVGYGRDTSKPRFGAERIKLDVNPMTGDWYVVMPTVEAARALLWEFESRRDRWAEKADGLENWKLSIFARHANKLAAMIAEATKEITDKETL